MDYRTVFLTDIHDPQRIELDDFDDRTGFSSSATMKLTLLVLSKESEKMNGLT